MKTKANSKSSGLSKQQKQLVALGALSVVLVGVMVMQFRGGEAEYQVAALSEGAVVEEVAPEAAVADAEPAPEPQDNPVLSQPASVELAHSPFANFWSRSTSEESSASVLPPPSIVLGLTIPGGDRPLAVIDGELRFVGDQVQGWTLAEVRTRAIVLHSPGSDEVVVEMPLFQGQIALPDHAPPEPLDG